LNQFDDNERPKWDNSKAMRKGRRPQRKSSPAAFTHKQTELEMLDVIKDFPGVRALGGVSISALKGEVLGLVGENGAGKSTLMKILSGVYSAGTFSGRIKVRGNPVSFRDVTDAKRSGIRIIHQELNLIPELSVAENIFLNEEPRVGPWIKLRDINRMARDVLKTLSLDIDPDEKIVNLPIGKRQMVEIAKAVRGDVGILILDEPTSALSEEEVDMLFELIHSLKEKGITCIYISHRLKEILHICDRITILKDGKVVRTSLTKDLTHDRIVSLMVGRPINEYFPKEHFSPGEAVLEVSGLSLRDPRNPDRYLLSDISFKARGGEILAIAGLMGSGRTELLMSIFGAFGNLVQGNIRMLGRDFIAKDPGDVIKMGISLVPEDRRKYGLNILMDIKDNITMPSLNGFSRLSVISLLRQELFARGMVERLQIKAPSLAETTGNLSGGNQQKVVVGKWLSIKPKVLMLDEPTKGIDVGAKYEIYKIMNDLTREGIAIMMVSSEMEEVLGMADRIMVMHKGRIAGELKRQEATEEKIIALSTGK